MSRSSPPPPRAATRAKRASEWERMFLRRYPLASRWRLALQIGSTLVSNGLVVWLLMSGRMTPFELVLLVAIEALLLIGIAWMQKRSVPANALDPSPMTRKDRVVATGFLLLWLGLVYGFVLLDLEPSGAEMLGALRDPVGFLWTSSIKWPLLITLTMAAIDARQDHVHFRHHGGTFFSTPGLQGTARSLTLLLGGIPLLVPVVGGVIGLKLGVDRVHAWLARRVGASHKALVSILLTLAVLAFVVTVLVLLDRVEALQRGVAWWALSFGAAKLVAELFIGFLPLIAATPVPHELADAGQADGGN